ncbi:hypothetical protein P9139_14465 [Curtobacterium flaccumfaciens]|nr:hypothetical protein P9139_14465 [Curtobacterium flaccumfaciens]
MTPAKTAKPQPNVTMRKPAPKPLDFVSETAATTPPPRMMSIAVPTSSEMKLTPMPSIGTSCA